MHKHYSLSSCKVLYFDSKNYLPCLPDSLATKAFPADLRARLQACRARRLPSQQAPAAACPELLPCGATQATLNCRVTTPPTPAQAESHRATAPPQHSLTARLLPSLPTTLSPRHPTAPARCHHLPPAAASEVEAGGTAPPADGAVLRRGRGRRVPVASWSRKMAARRWVAVPGCRTWPALGAGLPVREALPGPAEPQVKRRRLGCP